ncbi:hypothetical protein [Streptomyces triticirhizae]|uniref:Lipoprotein n=1 Tax=Streptomyces triticirhizae TaxID=2483353 RepID=A0A3M2LJ06_9ACTN|nr:hypothetical protein [Streptomyces triticirhizae]RMI35995.1 hypothetical protein EBN88_22650 [Streptomyces triticirhizae]
MLRHRLAATTALLLTLTACGGGSDDSADDPIPGVDEETTAPSEETSTPEAEPDPDDTEIPLPDDVELIFDWETPDDPDEAAAASNAANFLRAIAAGVVAQDADHSSYQGLSTNQAYDYARDQIQQWIDGGWTKTGTDRYYQLTVEQNESVIGVSFCRDSSEIFGKEIDTGEIVPVETTEYSSFSYYTIAMAEAPGAEGHWWASGIEVVGEAAECA